MEEPAVRAEPDVATVRRATAAVYAVFIANGFAFATFASRIPQVRDRLDLSPRALGLLLLFSAIGSIVALPLSGLTVGRLGEARTIAIFSVIEAAGLVIVGIGYQHGPVPVAAGLFLVGFGSSTWDVSMNVQGASVERHLGRAIMPRFHAGWSLGSVAAAVLGALLVATHVSVTVHLVVLAVVVALFTPVAVLRFLPHEDEPEPEGVVRRSPLAAWTEPRTLLIGVLVLCMAFVEGSGNDWIAVASIDGYHINNALGTITFAVFLAAMTTGRWFGPATIDRYGRVPMLRLSAGAALVGLAMMIFGHVYPVAVVGVFLWGIGASLGFPVGMSAAADEPRYAAARVSVAASIGYVAFLGGPPLIGFLGDHVGTLDALMVTGVLLLIALVVCPVTREPDRS